MDAARDTLTDEEKSRAQRASGSALVAVGVDFFLAEPGDETMLATITLATDNGLLGTWVGSTVGMVLADALAIGIGLWLGRRLPENVVTFGAAGAFATFRGLLTLQGLYP